MVRRAFQQICFIWAVTCLFALPAHSGRDRIALTVEIIDNNGTAIETIELTFADIKALPAVQVETNTIWTSGPQIFTGVWLSTLLNSLDVDSGQLELRALNDYYVTMPVHDAQQDGALVAYWRNHAAMSSRDNGPLWLVYDYDSDPKYRSETYYSRSIWQLDHIRVSR